MQTRLAIVFAAGAAALAAQVALADPAYTHNWTGGTVTGGPANAKELADKDNWDAGSYPYAADAWVNVQPAGSGAYLSLTKADILVNTLKDSSKTGQKIVGDKKLKFAPAGNGWCWCNIYTPVEISYKRVYFNLTEVNICDELIMADTKGGILAHGGTMYFRDGWWAKSGGNVDRTASKIYDVSSYAGSWSFHSPRAAATTGSFALTKGSVYATNCLSAATSACSGGQFVTGNGIQPGTYVRRIFDGVWIELSQPATETLASSALSFAARTVKVRYPLGTVGGNGATDTTLYVNRESEAEDYVVEIDKLQPYSNKNTTIATLSGIPGKIIIHNTTYASPGSFRKITLGRCFLEFAATTKDATTGKCPRPGLEWSNVYLSSGNQADLSAPAGIDAAITNFVSFAGSLVKLGAGSLTVGFASAGAPTATSSITVKDGSLSFVDAGSSAPVTYPGALTVKAGGTLVVPAQGLRLSSLTAESGATFAGTGTVYLTNLQGFSLPSGVTFGPGVRFASGASDQTLVTEVPAIATASTLPGDPAFWVDLTDQSTLTLVTLDESQWVTVGKNDFTYTFKQGVYRINDVRKQTEGDKYLFSTNVCGNAPTAHMPLWMWDKRKNLHHAYFKGNCLSGGNTTASVTNTDAHAWSKPIADIRVVFEVYGSNGSDSEVTGSMPFLGATSLARLQSVQSSDTVMATENANIWGRYAQSSGFFSWASPAMKAGAFHVNGTPTAPASDSVKPPYGSQLYVDDGQQHKWRCHPLVTDLTIPDTYDSNGRRYAHIADSYTFQPKYCGLLYTHQTALEQKRLCELIVYTNTLTKSEIASVRRYLMRKWLSQDAAVSVRDLNATRLGAANGPFEVAADKGLYAESVTDGGTFTKSGAGTCYVENAVAPSASVAVAAGTLKVRSYDVSKTSLTADDLVAVHLDASDKSNFTYSYDESRKVNTVTKWKDVKTTSGAANDFSIWQSGSTNKPFIAENALNGLSVLDFGKFYQFATSEGTAIAKSASVMTPNSQVYDCHSMIAVWGSANGGGTLLGEVGTYWGNGKGLARSTPTYGAAAGDKISCDEQHQSFANTYSYLSRLNGTKIKPTQTGLTGGYDIFSHVAWCQFELNALQAMDNDVTEWMGGGQIGELIVLRMGPSASHLDEIEAYLRKKWFNTETPGFQAATLGSVSVASGATLDVTGGAPLTVSALAVAGGTVTGDIVLSADAELTVTVNADGSVTPVSVDGSLDISKGGTVKFAGAPERLGAGPHVLARSIGSATADAWQVDVSPLRKKYRRGATLYVEGGNLCLRLATAGFVLTVR